jgi:hypothetical protein
VAGILKGNEALRLGIVRPRNVVFGGGLPIREGGLLIGGIGVSGGSAEQDEECARAGLAALAWTRRDAFLSKRARERHERVSELHQRRVRQERQRQDLREPQPGRQPPDRPGARGRPPEWMPRWPPPRPRSRATGAAVGGRALQAARRRGAEINRRFDDFLQAEIADTGKPPMASHIDIPRGAANFKIFTDTIKNVPPSPSRCARPTARPRSATACACRGRDRGGLPVEPAAAADDLEGRPGPGLRQHRGRQALRRNPATATLLGEVMNKVGVPKGVQRGARLRP